MGFLIITAFGFPGFACSEETRKPFDLPDALKSTTPEIPAEQNQLLRFYELVPSKPELVKRTGAALERLKKGEGVEDDRLLEELRERHRLAHETLKPPLAFGADQQLFPVPVFSLFKGCEVLARQALFERDRATAETYIDDLLRWSRLLRNSRPNMAQWAAPRLAWTVAFEILLQDLGTFPDPARRLDEIKQKFQQNPIESSELMEVVKAEARWFLAEGGLRTILKDKEQIPMSVMFLKPPFNELSPEELASLPYDFEADFRRGSADMLAILSALKQNTPISEWPGFQPHAVERTFEDYKNRPNGLGDLFHEQSVSPQPAGFWNSALSCGRLLTGCLRWLEIESGGGVVREELFADLLDPVNGKALTVDLQQRTIRSCGVNQKSDPREPELGPLPVAGFTISGDDSVIVVPRWKTTPKAGD